MMIGTATYGNEYVHLIPLPTLAGVITLATILVFISVLGLIGLCRKNQTILFLYICIMFLFFIVLLYYSLSALITTHDKQRTWMKETWSMSSEHQKKDIETMFSCCGFEMEDKAEHKCIMHSTSNNVTTCYDKLKEPISKVVYWSGGVGLFCVLMLLVGVFVTATYRNQLLQYS